MTEDKRDFQLSVDEFDFLSRAAAHEESLASLLKCEEDAAGRSVTIMLSRTEAEALRDSLTTLLATIGFDKDYSPNEQGRILERLIDRFYVCQW